MLQRAGLPLALDVDRQGSFRVQPQTPPPLSEQLTGERQPTQCGRALAALGLTRSHAQRPPAKGRVERLWGTLQDRLGSELRLAGAPTVAAANPVLGDFLPPPGTRFAVPAAQAGTAAPPPSEP